MADYVDLDQLEEAPAAPFKDPYAAPAHAGMTHEGTPESIKYARKAVKGIQQGVKDMPGDVLGLVADVAVDRPYNVYQRAAGKRGENIRSAGAGEAVRREFKKATGLAQEETSTGMQEQQDPTEAGFQEATRFVNPAFALPISKGGAVVGAAEKLALKQARKMEMSGIGADEIAARTGWSKAGREWKYTSPEAPDVPLSMHKPAQEAHGAPTETPVMEPTAIKPEAPRPLEARPAEVPEVPKIPPPENLGTRPIATNVEGDGKNLRLDLPGGAKHETTLTHIEDLPKGGKGVSGVTQESANLFQKLDEVNGTRTTIVDRLPTQDGIVYADDGRIFIAKDAKIDPAAVAGHEGWHHIKRVLGEDSALVKAVEDATLAGLTPAQKARYVMSMPKSLPEDLAALASPERLMQGGATPEDIGRLAGHFDQNAAHYLEELGADIHGDAAKTPEFWQKTFDNIAKAQGEEAAKSVLGRILDGLKEMLYKYRIMAKPGDYASRDFVNNYEKIVDALSEAHAGFLGKKAELEVKPPVQTESGAWRNSIAGKESPQFHDPAEAQQWAESVKYAEEKGHVDPAEVFKAEGKDFLGEPLKTDDPALTPKVSLPVEPKASVHRYNEWEANTAKWMADNGFSQKEIDNRLGGMRGQMTVMNLLGRDVERFPHGFEGSAWGPMRKNEEYFWSYDASAMCPKRLEAAATASYIQSKIPGYSLSGDDKTLLVTLFREQGKEAPCLICYVETPRGKAGDFVQTGLEILEGARFPRHDSGKNKGEYKWAQKTRDMMTEAKRELKANGKTTEDIDTNVLTDVEFANSPEAKEKMAALPKTYQALRFLMGGSKQNVPKLYEEYTGQVMKIPEDVWGKIMKRAGLRMFSSSDFQAEHAIDIAQFMFDVQARGGYSHAYTKVPAHVEIFGRTGQKINMSIFAEERGGKIVEDSWQGQKWADVQKYRKKFPDAGPILVGTSGKIIKWALDTPWVDFIIPFHHSGLPVEYKAANHWQDFTGSRMERRYPFERGDKVKEGFGSIDMSEFGVQKGISNEEGTRAYLETALKRKMSPMFPQFMFKDFEPVGDAGKAAYEGAALARWKAMVDKKRIDWDQINPNYFKVKKDYARTDTPFRPIKAEFDMEAMNKKVHSFLDGNEPKSVADEAIADRFMAIKEANEGKPIGPLALTASRQRKPMMTGDPAKVFDGLEGEGMVKGIRVVKGSENRISVGGKDVEVVKPKRAQNEELVNVDAAAFDAKGKDEKDRKPYKLAEGVK